MALAARFVLWLAWPLCSAGFQLELTSGWVNERELGVLVPPDSTGDWLFVRRRLSLSVGKAGPGAIALWCQRCVVL